MLIFASELAKRKYLDMYLSKAFNLYLEDGKLKVIDEHKYVLTLDYALKVCIFTGDAATTLYHVPVIFTTIYWHVLTTIYVL